MARKNTDPETRTQTVEVDHAANAAPAKNLLFPPAKDPVTMTASWLSKAEAKVVTAQHAERTAGTSAVAETKDAGDAAADDAGDDGGK